MSVSSRNTPVNKGEEWSIHSRSQSWQDLQLLLWRPKEGTWHVQM